MTSLLLLTGCVKVSFTGPKKEEKTSQSTSSKKEPLTFVRADQYKDQDNEVLEASEKFIKEHPTLGEAGKLFVFFPGYTFGNEENRFALFFIVNRTTTTIDRDGSFVLNLEYDGEPLFKDVTVDYEVSESGVLKPNTAAAIPIKITKEQEEKMARKMEKLKEKQERKKNKKNEQKAASSSTTATPKVAPISVGENVKIKGQTSVGQVMEISGKNAIVAFGSIKTTVKLDRLERSNAAPKTESMAKSTFVSSQTHDQMYEKKLSFKQDIDVRGMRGDEALQAVTYFIDDAILVGMDRVRILHGTGTGILRTLIRQYLSTVPSIRHYADEHVQFGGAGITVVDFD